MKPTAILCGLLGLLASAAHATDRDAVFAEAMQRYQNGEYARAYAGFRAAGDAGHRRAQEIAGLMALAGPRLYGGGVPHDPASAYATLQRAAESGSEVGRHVSCARARRNGEPAPVFCQPQ